LSFPFDLAGDAVQGAGDLLHSWAARSGPCLTNRGPFFESAVMIAGKSVWMSDVSSGMAGLPSARAAGSNAKRAFSLRAGAAVNLV